MVKLFDRVAEGVLSSPVVIRSGNTLVSEKNISLFKKGIEALAALQKASELRFERRRRVPEGHLFDDGRCSIGELQGNIHSGDRLQFVTVCLGNKVHRHIVVNHDCEHDNERLVYSFG